MLSDPTNIYIIVIYILHILNILAYYKGISLPDVHNSIISELSMSDHDTQCMLIFSCECKVVLCTGHICNAF